MDKTTKYAKMVLAGEIAAGKLVRLACKRHLDDLKKSQRKSYPYRFDVELANLRIEFYNMCRHYKGDVAGQPIKPELWQCFVQGSVFGWVDKKTGKRRFREVYEQIAKKNGKSTDAATTGLYCMTVDGEAGAEVYSAATTRKQARIIFETARQMISASPELKTLYNSLTNNINVPQMASKFEPVSSEAETLDGLDIHCALVDELHAHKTRAVYDILKGGTAARSQPLIWVVTTAGYNLNGICKERYDYSVKVLEGSVEDDTLFAYIAQIDEGDDPFDEKVWIKANPNLGVSVKIDDLRRKANEAKEIHSAYNMFLCKHLNIWVNASESWMNMQKWNVSGKDIFPILKNKKCWVGVDLSSKLDLTSVVALFPLDNGYVAVLHHSFIPEATINEKERIDKVPYSAWVRDGYITAIPGETIEQSWIEDYIMALSRKYKIQEVCYDPWSASEFAQHMDAEGFTCVEVRQGYRSLSEPMKDIERLVYDGKLIHLNDPVLKWAMSNVIATRDPADNIKPDKAKSTKKIDPVVAMITGNARAMYNNAIDLNDYIMRDDYIM
ncbi:MAG: terminase large subunit [Clostridiales bacterium]|nr:terminase large subunit [Clostridiales bacterium]